MHDKIADAIYDEKRQVELRRYLLKLRAQAIIEWKNPEIKKAWETRIAQEPPLPPDATAPPAGTPASTDKSDKAAPPKPPKPVKPTP